MIITCGPVAVLVCDCCMAEVVLRTCMLQAKAFDKSNRNICPKCQKGLKELLDATKREQP